jgi:hypothetical protein
MRPVGVLESMLAAVYKTLKKKGIKLIRYRSTPEEGKTGIGGYVAVAFVNITHTGKHSIA